MKTEAVSSEVEEMIMRKSTGRKKQSDEKQFYVVALELCKRLSLIII
jgi:hypothetical protein